MAILCSVCAYDMRGWYAGVYGLLGGRAHWCVAGLSAGSKDGTVIVDLVVVAGKRESTTRRIGNSAQPAPTRQLSQRAASLPASDPRMMKDAK